MRLLLIVVALSALIRLAFQIYSQQKARQISPSIAPPQHSQPEGAVARQAPTSKAIEEKVRAEWPGQSDLVLSELGLYTGLERNRVQMDILLLSKQSLEDLRWWVQIGNWDWRDVLDAAEYHPLTADKFLQSVKRRASPGGG